MSDIEKLNKPLSFAEIKRHATRLVDAKEVIDKLKAELDEVYEERREDIDALIRAGLSGQTIQVLRVGGRSRAVTITENGEVEVTQVYVEQEV